MDRSRLGLVKSPLSSGVHGKHVFLLPQGTDLPVQSLCCSHPVGSGVVAAVYTHELGLKETFPFQGQAGARISALECMLWSLEPKEKTFRVYCLQISCFTHLLTF